MGWLFQGNPSKFDVESYLAAWSDLVYWRTPQHAGRMQLGDRAFIWRAGSRAGVIALGEIVELPARPVNVAHREALGDQWWVDAKQGASSDEHLTGIRLDEIRLNEEDGFVPKAVVRGDSTLASAAFVRVPRLTVYFLPEAATIALERLWGRSGGPLAHQTFLEGEPRIRRHVIRERSPSLRRQKIAQSRERHRTLHCEICRETEGERYPAPLAERIFEVHHRVPLSEITGPTKTRIEDLMILCASCHRAIHATSDMDANLKLLLQAFALPSP